MIELFGDATGNSIRAAIALEESGLAYEPRKVTLARGEHRTEEYLQLNPTGRVPTLVDSDGPGGERLVLTQSNAIMLYIAEKGGTLLPPGGVERARALEWLFFFVTDVIAPSLQAFVLSRDSTGAHSDAIHRLNERALALYEHVDRRLADRPFLAGSSLTIADIAGFTITTALEAQLRWDALPHVRQWLERVIARPAVQRGRRVFG
jgi:GSH-dependent disulfide-bond oxidoreductase